MKNDICIKLWCDWAMLKKYVSHNAKKAMELIEYEGKEEEAMDVLGKLAGPLALDEIDSFIIDKLSERLEIKREIHESKYDEFSLYVMGPIVKNARAFVYDRDNDEWYHGYVSDIENVQIDDPADRYTYAVNGDYAGEFILDDSDYYVGINTTVPFDMQKDSDKNIVWTIKALKNYKLYSY